MRMPTLRPFGECCMSGEAIDTRKLGEASEYIPNYAFTAIAFNLDWSEPNRGLAVRVLRALRGVVGWTFNNLTAQPKFATANKSNVTYARRAPFEMIEGEMTPRDLRPA
jgi:hypothetical protein